MDQNKNSHNVDLLPFERQAFPAEYLEYYAIKRNNLFASIQAFSDLWNFYHLLDQIWLREFSDFEFLREEEQVNPLNLFMVVHAKTRISIELAFSTNFGEARSLLRDAVEYAAHAHHMYKLPEKQLVWINKELDPKAFRKAFEEHKRNGLFAGLENLYEDWRSLSDLGSHANIASISQHLHIEEEPDGTRRHEVRYTGGQSIEDSEQTLFSLLSTCWKMQNLFIWISRSA